MKLNWEKFVSFSVAKVGLFLIQREGQEPIYMYQEVIEDSQYNTKAAIEIGYEVRGVYYAPDRDSEKSYPVTEPICNCPDIVRADVCLTALQAKHKTMYPGHY